MYLPTIFIILFLHFKKYSSTALPFTTNTTSNSTSNTTMSPFTKTTYPEFPKRYCSSDDDCKERQFCNCYNHTCEQCPTNHSEKHFGCSIENENRKCSSTHKKCLIIQSGSENEESMKKIAAIIVGVLCFSVFLLIFVTFTRRKRVILSQQCEHRSSVSSTIHHVNCNCHLHEKPPSYEDILKEIGNIPPPPYPGSCPSVEVAVQDDTNQTQVDPGEISGQSTAMESSPTSENVHLQIITRIKNEEFENIPPPPYPGSGISVEVAPPTVQDDTTQTQVDSGEISGQSTKMEPSPTSENVHLQTIRRIENIENEINENEQFDTHLSQTLVNTKKSEPKENTTSCETLNPNQSSCEIIIENENTNQNT